jgi:hypothetical protein
VSTRSVSDHARLALILEHTLSSLRTDAVLRPRWWRPSWQAGYEAGLREAHETVQSTLHRLGVRGPDGAQ